MNVHDAIINRRSIRVYKDDHPTRDNIEKIINAAIWAPSGLNNQPWRFKIIKDKKIKSSLANYTKYADIIKSAPLAICVFLDNTASYDRDKDLMAIGACIQNMLLEAHSLGLATCWLGEILNRKEEVRDFLGLKEKYELMAVITIGYAIKEAIKGKRNYPGDFILN